MISENDLFNSRILIVDDNATSVELLEKTISSAGYTSILSITDPRHAKEIYQAYGPHLVLLDINMPYLNGFEVMEQFKHIEQDSYIPVLVLTAQHDEATRLRALAAGAQDFLTKPFNKTETLTRIRNMLRIRRLHNRVRFYNQILEKKVQERTIELHNTRLEIIRRLGQAAEYRDNETGDHIIRMSRMCALLGELSGMTEERTELLLNTSPMHDIGKIGIPDKILLKPGKLDKAEFEFIKKHTLIGAKLLEGSDTELMISARDIALTHHEKWDGTGYPKGLKGEDIPLEGRIAGLTDVFDALTSKRPYKDPYPIDKACEIIQEGREKHFDPQLVDLFLHNLEKFEKIKDEMSGEEDIPPADYQLSERDRQ
ncbi:MAG: response regulator [Desulfobulbaceae bacterium]|nr:response regulator [Desulfobulbaceae bacterium]